MPKIALHEFVENELEASSLAWSSLAWYWGLSFLGMSPRYFEYMQSGEYEIDKQFLASQNEEINRIPGYEPEITVKQRFDRAVDYYEYCFIQAKINSINPPWDYAPDLATMIAFRRTCEARPQEPNEAVDTTIDELLEANPKYADMWHEADEMERTERARLYQEKVEEALKYVESEVQPRLILSLDQLDKDTGFIETGSVSHGQGILIQSLDEAMPEEKQHAKLGDSYRQTTPKTGVVMITEGILGRYFKAGQSLRKAMWSPEKIQELSGIFTLNLRSWNQLMEYKETLK